MRSGMQNTNKTLVRNERCEQSTIEPLLELDCPGLSLHSPFQYQLSIAVKESPPVWERMAEE